MEPGATPPGLSHRSEISSSPVQTPAEIFGLDKKGVGCLKPGARADIAIIDPELNWKVDTERFFSKGRNCPFAGWELQGKPIMTVVGGEIVMRDGRIPDKGRERP